MPEIDKSLFRPELAGGPFFIPGSSTGLLLIHGFTATTAEVKLLADRFADLGYTIQAPLLPGHGTTLDDLDRCRWQDWADAVETAYSQIRGKVKHLVVGGESMGGLLSLYLAARHPDIELAMIYSPAIKVTNLWQSRFLYRFFPYMPKKRLDDGMAWQGYRYNSIRAGAQLYELQRQVRQMVRQIHQPVAIFLGAQDQTIDLGGARRLYNQIASPRKALFEYGYSGHCMILDHEVDAIFRQSRDLLREIIKE